MFTGIKEDITFVALIKSCQLLGSKSESILISNCIYNFDDRNSLDTNTSIIVFPSFIISCK